MITKFKCYLHLNFALIYLPTSPRFQISEQNIEGSDAGRRQRPGSGASLATHFPLLLLPARLAPFWKGHPRELLLSLGDNNYFYSTRDSRCYAVCILTITTCTSTRNVSWTRDDSHESITGIGRTCLSRNILVISYKDSRTRSEPARASSRLVGDVSVSVYNGALLIAVTRHRYTPAWPQCDQFFLSKFINTL